jgi:DNA repair protein RecN (Recombination protein N)
MLAELRVRDFAIIGSLALEFGPGFNVLTGETGAGKSILVDALGLLLGDRPHPDQIRGDAAEARLEAVFTDGRDLAGYLGEHGLAAEEDGSLVIGRRVGRNGRHQAYVNGSAVPVSLLAGLGEQLIDLHGQHEHQTLLRTAGHRGLLDEHGGLGGLRAAVARLHRQWHALEAEIARAEAERRELESRRDYLLFQARELGDAALQPGEEEELARTRSLMANAEKIRILAGEALDLLYQGEAAAAGQVESAEERMRELARHLPGMEGGLAELAGIAAALREIAGRLEDLVEQSEYDPETHARTEERLALIERLKRKYGGGFDDLLALESDLAERLRQLDAAGTLAEERHREQAAIAVDLGREGERLRRGREKAARVMEREMERHLADLGLGRARFVVRLTPREDPSGPVTVDGKPHRTGEEGFEEVEFLLAANPGDEPKSLARVASGGELSRLMLALKSSLAGADRVDTLIFDEIDSGIGGKVARTVGRKLKALAGGRQVICVTHLAAIASLADAQIAVSKEIRGGTTTVAARRLDGEERIRELARMSAGDRISETALAHARELMEERP